MSTPLFRNLDKTDAFHSLSSITPPSLPHLLTEARIDACEIDAGAGMRYNYAAKAVDERTLSLLTDLAAEQQLIAKYVALAGGALMNTGENRRVLHHMLRGRVGSPVVIEGRDMEAYYARQRERFYEFAERVRSGTLRGSTGKPFETIVQIGIGGSDLGPRALFLALKNSAAAGEKALPARFISNVDPDDPTDVLAGIDLESTLFVLVSKSGTTQETLTNQQFALNAMERSGSRRLNPTKHMVAVTSETSPLASSDSFLDAFFIDDNIGGRYSATSAVGGVILSCALGPDTFEKLIQGAHEADRAALTPDPLSNASLLDALIGVYERSVLQLPSSAILPYSQALHRFPAHLQQLDMESNGKRVNRNGEPVPYPTGPVIFGEPGTNGQHSFYQLLHQGTDTVPLQFIGFRHPQLAEDIAIEGSTSQEKLNANLAAQIVAFALGSTNKNPNKFFPGDRPSSLLHGDLLTPETAGVLLAHFENKVMFQGFAWNLNSFDQEGVQLGKRLAKAVLEGTSTDPVLKRYALLLGIHD